MGLDKLVALLDQSAYYPGETLSGRLVVEVDEPMPIIAIYLKYSGKGNVHWIETHRRIVRHTDARGHIISSHIESYDETYSNSEVYLALQQLVFGNDTDECELAQGRHVFVFNCQLPMNLPWSYAGMDGGITYSIEATMKRSTWKFNHIRRLCSFKVKPIRDLNHIAIARNPVAEQKGKSFWGHSNVLLLTANLPVRGYVPGQVIPVIVSVRNDSGVQVKSIHVSLVKNVTFHATTKSKTQNLNLFKEEFPLLTGLGSEDFRINIELPSGLPPSNLEFCKIIEIRYELNVMAQVKAWYHKNCKINTEIIVGNVPLTNFERPISGQQLPAVREPSQKEDPSYSEDQDHK